MKDHYEKIFDIVVKRGDERLKRKKIIMSRCTRVAFSLSGICAAIVVGFSIWHNKDINHLIVPDNNIIISEPSTVSLTTSTPNTVTSGTVSPQVTEKKTVTTKNHTTTSASCSTSKAASSAVTTATAKPLRTTNATQTKPVEQPTQATTTVVSRDIRINNPDAKLIIDKFSEIHLDDGTVYRLKQTDNVTPIGLKKETKELINDDSNENKRYIINAEIYDIALENYNGMIAVKYEGSNEVYYYSAVNDNVNSMEQIRFNVPFGKLGSKYVSCNVQHVDDKKIGEFLEDISLNGKNEITGEEVSIGAKVFKINNISSDCAIAIKYDTDNEYNVFRNINYSPETLGQLINDMNLEHEMIINGVYVDDTFYKIDPEKLWEILFNDRNIENCGSGMSQGDCGISIDIPLTGRKNIGITVNRNGYISTNIAESVAKFNIGTAKTKEFIDYVNQYGVIIENETKQKEESPLK